MDLKSLFEYDLWAGLEWLPVILEAASPEEEKVFRHILSAQKTWLLRCQGERPSGFPDVPLARAELVSMNQAWLDLLDAVPLSQVVSYHRFNGEALKGSFDSIASHVVNHGTYHRGHIRGLMQLRSFEGFPETDLIRFAGSREAAAADLQ